MDPSKVKEVKKLIKRQSRLANLRRIRDLTFSSGGKLIVCNSTQINVRNNYLTDLPDDLVKEIELLISSWIEKEANILDSEFERL